MPAFEGLVEDIVFRNEDNGWTVMSFKPDKGRAFTVVGVVPFLIAGERAYVEGEWVEHRDYGKQLKCEKYESLKPTTKTGIERYLASGIIRGVGPATAKLLVKHFGAETLEIMDMYPNRLTEVEGIGPKRAQMIAETYQEQQETRQIMVFLAGFGLSPAAAMRIYKRYGDNAKALITENPYRLADEVQGFGFQTADAIALQMGFQKTDERRLRSGIKYVLSDAVNNYGHAYLPRTKLISEAARMMQVDQALSARALIQLILKGEVISELVQGDDAVYLKGLYEAESDVAFRLLRLAHADDDPISEENVDSAIENSEREQMIAFSTTQKEAIRLAAGGRVSVITGGPGTGKTTLIKCLIKLFGRIGKIELCAPTGRAAKRMTEATGQEAKTIHRLLEYSGEDEAFKKGLDDPLDAKIVIVDEMSMVDIFLMKSLLRALRKGTRLILSGDADQLPSVGAGNVLGDLIESGVLSVVRLTEIFRQAERSAIVRNAHRINKGEYPIVNEKGTDFFMERVPDVKSAAQSAINLVKTRLPNFSGLDPMRDIQVMTPMKKGDAGVIEMNRLLQEALNPKGIKAEFTKGDVLFRLGDKVMQVKNNYSVQWRRGEETGEGVFNGDIGFITELDAEERIINVTFDDGRQAEYDDDTLDELELAYCMSVHKSQGSEFEAVVLPLISGPQMLMTRNLLYTAVTRAKRLVVITGREECVRTMVDNNHIAKRYTALSERLKMLEGDRA